MSKKFFNMNERFFSDFSKYEVDRSLLLRSLQDLNSGHSFYFSKNNPYVIITDINPYAMKMPDGFYLSLYHDYKKFALFITNRDNTKDSIGSARVNPKVFTKLNQEIRYEIRQQP